MQQVKQISEQTGITNAEGLCVLRIKAKSRSRRCAGWDTVETGSLTSSYQCFISTSPFHTHSSMNYRMSCLLMGTERASFYVALHHGADSMTPSKPLCLARYTPHSCSLIKSFASQFKSSPPEVSAPEYPLLELRAGLLAPIMLKYLSVALWSPAQSVSSIRGDWGCIFPVHTLRIKS